MKKYCRKKLGMDTASNLKLGLKKPSLMISLPEQQDIDLQPRA